MSLYLRPYRAYRDSGVPWLGPVPDHWSLTKTKYLFRERSEKGHPHEPLLAATQTRGVVRKELYENRTVLALKDLHLLKLVRCGDFVISLRSFQGGIEYAHEQGIISPAYTVLRPLEDAHPGYFAALFKSQPFIQNLSLFITGIRQGQNIDYERLSRASLPVPPGQEPEQISRYVAHVNQGVGRLIRAKRRMIALLNEQKQAVIQRAVTRGLDPHARLKPSGVEWLGDAPEHWDVRRFRTLVRRIDQGVSPQAEAGLAEGGAWGVLKAGCVNRGVFRDTEHKRLPDSFPVDPTLAVQVGDVLVSRASGSPSLVGSVGRVETLRHRLMLSDKTFRPVFNDPRLTDFLVFAMNTRYFRVQVEQAISGAEGLANNLPLSELKDFRLLVPPPKEAEAIAAALRRSTVCIDAAVRRIEREVELLREYRTRLVSDVVTGKLDVRGVELPELDTSLAGEELEGEESEDEPEEPPGEEGEAED